MYFQTPRPDTSTTSNDDQSGTDSEWKEYEEDHEILTCTNEATHVSVAPSAVLTKIIEDDADIDSENGYDTDFDEENEGSSKRVDYEEMVIDDYKRECENLGVVPVTYFQKHVKDRTFVMRYHGLGPLGAQALVKPLEINTTIESLNLEGNDIQGEGVEHICRVFKENAFITVLKLSDNTLGTLGAKVICDAFQGNRTIKQLDLSSNGFSDNDGEHFCNMLLANKTLETLILKHNKFETTAAIAFKTALSENEFLRNLDLSWNNIHLKGAVHIAEMVKENYGLKTLDLSMNGLGNTGAAALGIALKSNQCLLELNIMSNRITTQGAMQFAKGLVENEILEIAKLGRNPIGVDGAFGLLCAIGNNKQSVLKLLDLTGVIIKEEFESLLDNMNNQRENQKLIVFHAGLLYQHNVQLSDMDPRDYFERDPMTRLKRYAEKRKLRLVDLFRQFDKDQSWSVNRQEFVQGIKSIGIDMSDKDIETLMATLDKEKNGEIYYKEFMTGDSSNRAQLRQIMREANEQKEKEKENKRKNTIEEFQFEEHV